MVAIRKRITLTLLSAALLFSAVGVRPSECLADAESHRAAAERLLNVFGVRDQILAVQSKIFEPQLSRYKDLGQAKLVLPQFYAQYMSYEVLRNDLLALFTKEFSEEELNAASDFYGSPAGKKWLERTRDLRAQVGSMIMAAGQSHITELRSMLKEELRGTEPDLKVEPEPME